MAARDLPTELSTAVEQPVVRPFMAILTDTPDPVYVFTGRGQLSFADADGVTRAWLGAGDIGSIDTLTEATDGSAQGIKVSLLRVPSEFREDIAAQAVPGVKMDVGLGAFNETYQIVEGFKWLNRYKLDDFKITDSGDNLSVQISGENRAIDQKRPAIKRFTDENQQRDHPGDLFFQFVPQMAEVSILWANAEAATPVANGGGGGGGTGGGLFLNRAIGD